MKIEIMDTTLRDGEQTSGVSFSAKEKLNIAHMLLLDLKVNRIEIASARVSEGEFETVKKIAKWAKDANLLNSIEVLGFVDNGKSLQWIKDTGCCVMNLLTKGSLNHLTHQLKKTPEQHLSDIKEQVALAKKMNIEVNMYLEDWSNGVQNDIDYLYFMLEGLKDTPIKRFMLPDTLGILEPQQTFNYFSLMTQKYPEYHFDFHAHNDYDLAVANTAMAAKAGARGVHVTVNGLGERAGNAPLSSVVAVLHDKLKIQTDIVESKFNTISYIVESCSGLRIPANKPIIGENVFTQCAGVHADGDHKKNLYFNELLPERFGRKRKYALGKNSGLANIRKNLESLGIELDDKSMAKVTKRIIKLGDKKKIITQEDLPFIISDILERKDNSKNIKILAYSLSLATGLRPVATIKIEINGKTYTETSPGAGQFHAFSKALWKIYNSLKKPYPELTDYSVIIPPGGKTNALVHTVISWNFNNKDFKTRGLDVDQTTAAIQATEKMLNIIEQF